MWAASCTRPHRPSILPSGFTTSHSEVPRSHLSPGTPWHSCSPSQSAPSNASLVSQGSDSPATCLLLSGASGPFALYWSQWGKLPHDSQTARSSHRESLLLPKGDLFPSLTSPNSFLYNLLEYFPKKCPRLPEPRTWVWAEIFRAFSGSSNKLPGRVRSRPKSKDAHQASPQFLVLSPKSVTTLHGRAQW